MERYNPTLATTRVHVLDLYPRKALCFRSMFPSSTLTPFLWLRNFTKLLRLSICIELIVALMPTIPRVCPPLSLIFTSTLSVLSYDVASTNALLHSRSCNDSLLLTRSIELCRDIVLRNSSSTCAVRCT
ncbi:hypothetical protein B296_00001129 [Ensete ventricosum]|uniref:Uncharacterized protein n=1 Tax=Ensete ventricosum TaxID=4639 RepID=A0A427BAT2_ENSVE|nr:hypothetical protein B296_00001129 [Ensete ventricosum]